MDAILTVKNLSKIYGIGGAIEVRALQNVSFDIQRGNFVALMGRSGSGKSTLLHQIGLIDTPTMGSIVIDQVPVLDLSDTEKSTYRLKHFGHIFQEYALLPELTALENVSLPAFALQGNFSTQKAGELLELVGLKDRLHHYPHELSGGEQQRVAIARALVNDPKIVFADEPTANLDTISAETVLSLFQKLNRERGQTIIMITHETEDRKYVDTVITLKDGIIDSHESVTDRVDVGVNITA